MESKPQTTNQERPTVSVAALTANSCEIVVVTSIGEARIIASHEVIDIESRGLKIQVKP